MNEPGVTCGGPGSGARLDAAGSQGGTAVLAVGEADAAGWWVDAGGPLAAGGGGGGGGAAGGGRAGGGGGAAGRDGRSGQRGERERGGPQARPHPGPAPSGRVR